MSNSSQQVAQRDITAWGIAALVCGALAVFAASVGGMMPEAAVSALHATRGQSGSLAQLRADVAQARAAANAAVNANRTLQARFDLIDRRSTEVMRRVVAVEQSVPLLIEALPVDSDIDRSLLTASIGPGAARQPQEIEGGLMLMTQVPMFPGAVTAGVAPQPLPAPLETGTLAEGSPEVMSDLPFAVLLGTGEDRSWAETRWEALTAQVGPLLLGLEPRVLDSSDGLSLVAGPFTTEDGAQILCTRIEQAGAECMVGTLAGEPLFATE